MRILSRVFRSSFVLGSLVAVNLALGWQVNAVAGAEAMSTWVKCGCCQGHLGPYECCINCGGLCFGCDSGPCCSGET